MPVQLRVYEIEPGRARDFAGEWSAKVLPLRQVFGFAVLGAWVSDSESTFAWLLSHHEDFEAADTAYYASPERAALDPDPARLVARIVVTTMVEPVVP